MPYLPDILDDIADTYAWQARRDNIQAQADSMDLPSVQRLVQFARVAPWVKPGVALGMARAGISPSDPAFDTINKLSLHDFAQLVDLGRPVSGAQMDPGQHQISAREAFNAYESRSKSAVGERTPYYERGFRPASHLNLPEGLRRLLDEFGAVDSDGFIHEPDETNIATTSGRRWEGIKRAFNRAGISLPFFNRSGEPIVINNTGIDTSGTPISGPPRQANIAEQVAREESGYVPPSPSSGSAFGQLATGAIPTKLRPRQTDPRVADNLRQMGIPVDTRDPFAPLAMLSNPAGMVLNAPIQEVQGQVRNIYAATHGRPVEWLESQSDLGVAIRAIRDGKPITDRAEFIGMGFFTDPESYVSRERRDREAKRGQIGGHNITAGRWLADTVTEPDTTPFNILSGVVDAGIQLYADPTILALNKASSVRRARDLFAPENADEVSAGLFRALRRDVGAARFSSWRVSTDGQNAINALTDETNPARIWRAMSRRVDPAVAARFADTRTTEETEAVLEDLVGTVIRKPSELKSTTANLTPGLMPRHSSSRFFQMMPGDQIDTLDRRNVATQLERHLDLAGASQQTQEEVINLVARSTDRAGIRAAYLRTLDAEDGILVGNGIDKEWATKLTKAFDTQYNAALDGLSEEVGIDTPIWTKMMADGKEVEVPGPHLSIEHGDRYLPLPDARVIKRLTSNPKFRWLTTSMDPDVFGQSTFPIAAMDFVTQQIWKPLTLLGRFPAWIARVVGESQIRMAASGRSSMFKHPIDYLSFLVRGNVDPSGVELSTLEEWQRSIVKIHGGWLDRPGTVVFNEPQLFQKAYEGGLSDFRKAWADNLAHYASDPIVNHLLNHDDLDETVSWLQNDPAGNKILQDLISQHPGNLLTRQQIEAYLHRLAGDVVHLTGGNVDLYQAVKHGNMNGIDVFVNVNQTNPAFTKALDSYLDAAPKVVKGTKSSVSRQTMQLPDRWNRGVDWAFSHTMSLADNFWDRNPTFKQYLWQHTRELLPYATEDAQQAIIKVAREKGIPKRVIRSLERAAKTHSDKLAQEELTFLARGYAADSSKALLYDLAEKNQLVDGLRILAPFANAYAEIFGSWSRMLNEIGGPGWKGKLLGGAKIYRRAQQIITAARGEDFGQVVGAPAGEGFFFKDPYGQEAFVIPGTQWLTMAETGVPVPMTGSVQNLNMVGSILPGLGPVAAVPVGWMIQDKPQFEGINDLLLPYGSPGSREPSDATNLLTYAPGWMRKSFDAITNGGYDQRTWMNAQKDVMTYLYSTGNYDTSTRAGIQKLMSDAKAKATELYKIRAFVQFFSPAAPQFRFLMEDKTGALLSTTVVVQDYYRLQQEDYDHASQNFLEMYGPNAILATIPKSGATIYGLPRNREQEAFALNHPNLKHDLPLTWGMFLPQSDDFDYEVYLNGFTTGERDELTPEQWIYLGNATRRDALYRQYVDQLGGRTDDQATDYLRAVRHELDDMFPVGVTGLPEKPTTPDMVRELYEALDNPTVMDTDAGRGLKLYLQYRDQAVDAGHAAGYEGDAPFARADRMIGVRRFLNDVAARIIEDHPDFAQVWDVILSRETQVDEPMSNTGGS